jgi:hypothetical protein
MLLALLLLPAPALRTPTVATLHAWLVMLAVLPLLAQLALLPAFVKSIPMDSVTTVHAFLVRKHVSLLTQAKLWRVSAYALPASFRPPILTPKMVIAPHVLLPAPALPAALTRIRVCAPPTLMLLQQMELVMEPMTIRVHV